MTWHPKVLGRQQLRVVRQIGPALASHGFYLGGGTAVALHLGHRRSVDLDWFAPEFDDVERLLEHFRDQGMTFVTEAVAPGTLHGTVRGVRVSLLRNRYPRLARLRTWRDGIRVAACADLAAMKLLAVAQRGSKKDFVDIFALAGKGNPLPRMLRWYQKKYDIEDTAHLMRSLVYYDDADPERMPRMLWKIDWRTVKDTLRRWVASVPR